nr:RepB family plasmid replication initiator protein [Phocaeicola vulgatus]
MVNREIKARKRAVKEEKEEIDGEIVRIRKGHPRTNLPVKLPENPTWLKQPNVVTLMAGDFKTVQIRILIAVIEKLQDVIELSIQHLDKYGTSIPCEQLSLFQEYSDRIRVDIAYRDLGVNPDQYKEVKSMVRKLISIPVELDVKDPITGEDSWSITGLFTKANIPKTPYSRGFSLEMDREVAKVL